MGIGIIELAILGGVGFVVLIVLGVAVIAAMSSKRKDQ